MGTKRVVATLPPGWLQSDQDGDITTFVREHGQNAGALQVSSAWHLGGVPPSSEPAALIDFARSSVVSEIADAHIETQYAAPCRIGQLGCVVARKGESRIQVWCLSNGYDFVVVSHVTGTDPDPIEIREAELIVNTMQIANGAPARPWWRFW